MIISGNGDSLASYPADRPAFSVGAFLVGRKIGTLIKSAPMTNNEEMPKGGTYLRK